jgi:hypothetical protein
VRSALDDAQRLKVETTSGSRTGVAAAIVACQTPTIRGITDIKQALTMSNNPFADQPVTNPYASPSPQTGDNSANNPLTIPASVLLTLSSLTVMIILGSLPIQFANMRAIDTSTSEGVGAMAGMVAALIAWPVMNLAIVFGAISMLRLKSYSSAYTAAILAVIPVCSPCYFLGIPFGIWAIIQLRRPELKQRFT